MSSKLGYIISGLVGAGVGALCTYVIMKKNMASRINEEVSGIRQWFEEKNADVMNHGAVIPENPESKDIVDESGVTNADYANAVDIVKEHSKYIKQQGNQTNYSNVVKVDTETKPVEYIYEIDEDSFGEDYITETFTLYSDNVLTDESDNPIGEPKSIIGICVEELSEKLDEHGEIYFRNDILKKDFLIYEEAQRFYPPDDE